MNSVKYVFPLSTGEGLEDIFPTGPGELTVFVTNRLSVVLVRFIITSFTALYTPGMAVVLLNCPVYILLSRYAGLVV